MIKTEFSIDNIKNVFEEKRQKNTFSSTFVFPIEQRKEIEKYLREHKSEIVKEIIERAVSEKCV